MEKDKETEAFVSTEQSSNRLIKETLALLSSLNHKTGCDRMSSQPLSETDRLELLIKLEEKEQQLTEMKEKLRRLLKSRIRKRNKAARRFDEMAVEVSEELEEAKKDKVGIDRVLKIMLEPDTKNDKPYNQEFEDQKAEIIKMMKDLQSSYVEEETALTEETGLVQQDKEERDKECEKAIVQVKKKSEAVKLLSNRVKEAMQRLRRPQSIQKPRVNPELRADAGRRVVNPPRAACGSRVRAGGCGGCC